VVWKAVRHDSKLKAPPPPQESLRQWLSGVVVVVAIVVSFIGFAHISVGWTLLISTLIFCALIAFLWAVGGGKKTD
jgi:hypothetical protein